MCTSYILKVYINKYYPQEKFIMQNKNKKKRCVLTGFSLVMYIVLFSPNCIILHKHPTNRPQRSKYIIRWTSSRCWFIFINIKMLTFSAMCTMADKWIKDNVQNRRVSFCTITETTTTTTEAMQCWILIKFQIIKNMRIMQADTVSRKWIWYGFALDFYWNFFP